MCFKWCWSCCTCLRQGLSAFLVMKCHLNNQTWTLCSKQEICIRQIGAVQCKMTMKAANVTQKLTNSLIRWLEDFEHCNLTGCLAFLRAPPKIHPKHQERPSPSKLDRAPAPWIKNWNKRRAGKYTMGEMKRSRVLPCRGIWDLFILGEKFLCNMLALNLFGFLSKQILLWFCKCSESPLPDCCKTPSLIVALQCRILPWPRGYDVGIGVFNKRPVKNSMPQASGLGKWSCFQPEHSPVKEREPCLSANSSTQQKDKLISDVTFTYFFFRCILRCIPGSEPRVMSSSNSFIITQGSNSSEHALRNKQRQASARYLTEWCKHLLSLQIRRRCRFYFWSNWVRDITGGLTLRPVSLQCQTMAHVLSSRPIVWSQNVANCHLLVKQRKPWCPEFLSAKPVSMANVPTSKYLKTCQAWPCLGMGAPAHVNPIVIEWETD